MGIGDWGLGIGDWAEDSRTLESDLASSEISQQISESAQLKNWYTSERISGNIQTGDFVVGPGRAEISLKPGESKVVYLSLTNRISANRTFELEVADISGSVDGSSALEVIENGRGPYSILDYVSLPANSLVLDLGERARIPVTLQVPQDAEPGGYYGSILVSTVQPGSAPEDPVPRNPIIARVGSHIFLTVEGDREVGGELLTLQTIPSQMFYADGPIKFAISFENTGSIHLNPYGEMSIKNTFGDEVGFVELEPWFVLPQSIRTREVEWNREFLLGRYTAELSLNRGYGDIVDVTKVSFWVIPYQLIAIVFGALFLLFFLVRLFFRTFEFKRK